MANTHATPWLRVALLGLLSWALVAAGPAALAGGKEAAAGKREFKILMESRKIGWETYSRVLDAGQGVERIEAQSSAYISGQQIRSRQTLVLEAGSLEVREYHLTASVMGLEQQICICGVDQAVHFEIRTMGQEKRADPPRPDNLVVLDNLVLNHYEILLDRYDWLEGGRQSFHAAVPQVQQIIPLTAEAVPAPRGTYQGKAVELRQLRLTLAGLVINVLGSVQVPGELLAVEVPMQKLEFRRDGFQVEPSAPSPASTDSADGFEEQELKLRNGEITLGGTLTLPRPRPKKKHALPAVVLVHGSGPQDRDETIGPNKPFRDLAHDLARRGIAVYRYDKRTFAAKDSLDPSTLTVEEETIADAVAAVSLLRGRKEIDPRRVYLAGHSLGGMAAPAIARRAPELAGVIILAGSNLPLDEMIIEQSEYLARRRGMAEASSQKIEQLRRLFARLRAGEIPEDQFVLGAGVRYWNDLLARDPLAELGKLPQRVLILAGDKDYQVPPRHFHRWLEACRKAGKDDCSGQLLPGLNHLLMPVEGESDGTEYQVASRVSAQVSQLIAAWIDGPPKGKPK